MTILVPTFEEYALAQKSDHVQIAVLTTKDDKDKRINNNATKRIGSCTKVDVLNLGGKPFSFLLSDVLLMKQNDTQKPISYEMAVTIQNELPLDSLIEQRKILIELRRKLKNQIFWQFRKSVKLQLSNIENQLYELDAQIFNCSKTSPSVEELLESLDRGQKKLQEALGLLSKTQYDNPSA